MKLMREIYVEGFITDGDTCDDYETVQTLEKVCILEEDDLLEFMIKVGHKLGRSYRLSDVETYKRELEQSGVYTVRRDFTRAYDLYSTVFINESDAETYDRCVHLVEEWTIEK